jgi:hypothetical protein
MIDFGKNPEKMSERELRNEVKEWRDMQKQRDETPDHWGPYGPVCMNIGKFDAGECYICYAKRMKQESGENQLVAGRYQYLHEQAQKAINKIDDLFEYQYKAMEPEQIRKAVYESLSHYTGEVSKLITKSRK